MIWQLLDVTCSHQKFFSILEKQEPGAGNEVQLTDAIDTLNKTQRVFAREFKGKRYDVGDKFGFMKTSLDYALKHPQVKDDLKAYIIQLGKALEKTKTIKIRRENPSYFMVFKSFHPTSHLRSNSANHSLIFIKTQALTHQPK
ncbi:glucose-1-phosphate uridylyltransferase [Streptococcus pyogenes]|nr:glucose-1-phosphate uridylyltransferase [Streptococcus pyogenes]